jgi:hypothetical protein
MDSEFYLQTRRARSKGDPLIVEVDKLGYGITIPRAFTASNTLATRRADEAIRDRRFHQQRSFVLLRSGRRENMLNDFLAHTWRGEQVP